MKGLRKIWIVMVSVLVMAGLLAGCGDKNKLADVFDEETVKEQAMKDITTGESGDFEAWKARFPEGLQAGLTQGILDNYLDMLKEKGEFKEFGKCAVIGQEQDGKNYAVVICAVKHEKGEIRHTLTYDEDMNLIQYLI